MADLARDAFGRTGSISSSDSGSGLAGATYTANRLYRSGSGTHTTPTPTTDGAILDGSYSTSSSGSDGSGFAMPNGVSVGDGDHYITDIGGVANSGDPDWTFFFSSGHLLVFARYGVSTGANVYRLGFTNTGALVLSRLNGTSAVITNIASVATGLSYGTYGVTSTPVRIHLQVRGSSPTTLRARAWYASGSEPTTWDIDTTDNSALNQRASGACGWEVRDGYSSSAGTTAEASGDDYLVTDAAAAAEPGLKAVLTKVA